jgi:hypothetical protein
VILDEAHNARRRNLSKRRRDERADPNNLLKMVRLIAPQTRSMLLATATPVQIDPIEAFDLLDALNLENNTVLGSIYSRWLKREREGLSLVAGEEPPESLTESWEWMRDPFPSAIEGRDFAQLRSRLGPPIDGVRYLPEALINARRPDQDRIRRLSNDFFKDHNPYIRHIVRRTREFLEKTIDESTGDYYLPKVKVRLFGEEPDQSVPLPSTLADAYEAAEEFCKEVGKRPNFNSGFLETMLLRRVGSTIVAGRLTAQRMLGPQADDEASEDDIGEADDERISNLYPLSDREQEKLHLFLTRLENSGEDPKHREVERILLEGTEGTEPWLNLGCIVFTQYFESAEWIAERLSDRLPVETVAVYAGSGRSRLYRAGEYTPINREVIKAGVREGSIRLVIGSDAASEGLNLQRLSTLINLDLPWNPTRLEQRKGRIQRIGQARDTVYIYNMRYRGSVEDRVHRALSKRLAAISGLFGELPDTLEDVWVTMAQKGVAEALQKIDEVPTVHPFQLRYDRISNVDWESCSDVLESSVQLEMLAGSW